jgi:hypothetical protein
MSFSIVQDGGRYPEGGQALDPVLPQQRIVGFSIAGAVVLLLGISDFAIGGPEGSLIKVYEEPRGVHSDIGDERSSNQLSPVTADHYGSYGQEVLRSGSV